MIGEQNKLKDLEQLKRFVIGPVVGYSSHLWYGTLRARYPLQFIKLMRDHRNRYKTQQGLRFDDALISEAVSRINEAHAELRAYILQPPEDEAQRKELDRIAFLLDEFLQRQEREN